MSQDRDKKLYGAFGDSVIGIQQPETSKLEAPPEEEVALCAQCSARKQSEERKQSEGPKSFKPNATVYLKSIKDPECSDKIRRRGCTGWPCHDGFLCDFCMLRPEWIAEGKVEPLLEEVSELKQTIANLRAQQADVETLKKAERLVTGKHWSTESDTRISTLNSMLEDSRARIEAQEAKARCAAAETVRDSLITQLTTLQERMEEQERVLTGYKQKVEALNESLADLQHQLRFATSELAEKRMLISDAIKEKSRFRDMSRTLQSTIDVQNHELIVRGEQTKALILEVQRLQGVEGDRNKFKEIASQRAMIAQSIMDAVSEDVIMAERMRDEHTHQIRKLNKEIGSRNKSLQSLNTSMAKLRTENTQLTDELKRTQEVHQRELQMRSRGSFSMSRNFSGRGLA